MQELQKSNGSNSNTSSLNTASSTPIKENPSLSPEDLDERWLRWKCLKCGFVYEGSKPLNVCPKCGNSDPDLFDDAS